uniref:TBC1 domain family member 22B-like n=1 Tax=Sinocyclocheilus grahami TaxID=75366 RepID=A0A672MZD0_SINGR
MSGDGSKKQFWKRNTAKVPGNIQHVYGAQHPPFDPLLHAKSYVIIVFFAHKKYSRHIDYFTDVLATILCGDSVFSLLSEVGVEQAVLHRQHSLPHRPVIPLVARMADQNTSGTPAMTEREASRLDKFRQVLAGPNTDLEELRKLSWSGIPRQVRPITWKLLSGYLPANAERRESTLHRKRQEYFGFIEQYYDSRNDEHHQDTYRQIHIDIPRMSPESLVLQPKVTEIFERILFIWAIRHPASGYVQGINDLVTPFFVVYVFEYIEEEVENFNVSSLQEEVLQNIEADSFWCMSKLLDGIQDNYTFAQPGIQRKVKALEKLVSRIDETVHRHMQQYEVEYLQFAFRWMNNLLMRELPLRCTIRLWDTCQAEPEGFSHFHLYVCAAFLVRWRKEILEEKDFQVRCFFVSCCAVPEPQCVLSLRETPPPSLTCRVEGSVRLH